MIRVATWNLKQAVAPKKRLDELWAWLGESVSPTVAVLTEARVPKSGVPAGWQAQFTPGGYGPRRSWGTVLAARGATLRALSDVKVAGRTCTLALTWPAGVQVADLIVDGDRWATIVGVYGITVNKRGESVGHGGYSVPTIAKELAPLLASDRGARLILAGDFNLWPNDANRVLEHTGLIDLTEYTRDDRPALDGCSGCGLGTECGHMWTHKNGNSPNAARQQIDYIFATEQLADELGPVYGGVQHFTDAWEVSDHAPVVAEFA